MDPFHMVKQIPASGKAISNDRAITFREVAQVWFLAMAVHSVSFALMPEETCCGGKLGDRAS